MRLQSQPRWLLLPRPDLLVERSTEPRILKLDTAVDWIKKNKPLLWVGSIFSVPEPSGFPSGYAVTRSLFDLIFPADGRLPENVRDQMINTLMPRWPLEALFDEFEFLDCLSESLLAFFADLDRRAKHIIAPVVWRFHLDRKIEPPAKHPNAGITTGWAG